MIIGIDIGNTLTKIAYGIDENIVEFDLDIGREDGEVYCLEDALRQCDTIALGGMKRVAVTGAGSDTFLRAAHRTPGVHYVPHGDEASVQHELRVQLLGVRKLAERQGVTLPKTFMVVSIGTGTSYARVKEDGTTESFLLGNPIGGGTLVGYENDTLYLERGNPDLFDMHGDILMKHRYPELDGDRMGELVLSSGGALGKTNTLSWVTNAKRVADQVTRDLFLMQAIPEWQSSGPVVVIGSPVDRFPVLKYWLQKNLVMLTDFTGQQCHFLEDSAFAGALGAYHTALEAEKTA